MVKCILILSLFASFGLYAQPKNLNLRMQGLTTTQLENLLMSKLNNDNTISNITITAVHYHWVVYNPFYYLTDNTDRTIDLTITKENKPYEFKGCHLYLNGSSGKLYLSECFSPEAKIGVISFSKEETGLKAINDRDVEFKR